MTYWRYFYEKFIYFTLLIVLLSGCKNKESSKVDSKEVEEYVPVSVSNVKKETLIKKISFSGKVVSNKDIFVVPKIMGKVDEINVKIGSKVSKGSLLFTLENDEMKKQVKSSESELKSLIKDYNEILDSVKKGNLKLSSSLETIKAGINQARLAHDKSLEMLNSSYVICPIDGVVSSINISVGNIVTNKQPSIVVSDIDTVKVVFYVSEENLNKIKTNETVFVNIPSVNKRIKSKIYSVSPTADLRTNQYEVIILLNNKNHLIKPGMSGNVVIETVRENVNVIESEAIISKNDKNYVYVAENGVAKEKEVVLGYDNGEFVEIISGVNENDLIIIKGQNYLGNLSSIRIVEEE